MNCSRKFRSNYPVSEARFRIFLLPIVVDVMELNKKTDCLGIALHVVYRFPVLLLGFYLLALLTIDLRLYLIIIWFVIDIVNLIFISLISSGL